MTSVVFEVTRAAAMLGSVEQKTTRRSKLESEPVPSFEQLAARQEVQPVTDFDRLLGHPSADDESAEEFTAMLREWRCEGTPPRPQ